MRDGQPHRCGSLSCTQCGTSTANPLRNKKKSINTTQHTHTHTHTHTQTHTITPFPSEQSFPNRHQHSILQGREKPTSHTHTCNPQENTKIQSHDLLPNVGSRCNRVHRGGHATGKWTAPRMPSTAVPSLTKPSTKTCGLRAANHLSNNPLLTYILCTKLEFQQEFHFILVPANAFAKPCFTQSNQLSQAGEGICTSAWKASWQPEYWLPSC
jgi:hypothetical protein